MTPKISIKLETDDGGDDDAFYLFLQKQKITTRDEISPGLCVSPMRGALSRVLAASGRRCSAAPDRHGHSTSKRSQRFEDGVNAPCGSLSSGEPLPLLSGVSSLAAYCSLISGKNPWEAY